MTVDETTQCDPPDGTSYPWAQDLDGVWHKRPAGDQWTPAAPDPEAPQAHSICSAGPIHSVHCSSFRPDELPLENGASMCPECLTLVAAGSGGEERP